MNINKDGDLRRTKMNIDDKNYIFSKWTHRGVYDHSDIAIKLRVMLPFCSRFLATDSEERIAHEKARSNLLQNLKNEFLSRNIKNHSN